MAKYEWSEIFLSIEGEAKYTGWPTVYIRFARCNFQCRAFNNPENLDTTSIDVLGFNPKDYSSIKDIPMITRGCDSIYSWDQKFQHMWKKGTQDELAEDVMEVVPGHEWQHPVSGLRTILSLTGGEPTLRAKTIPPLLWTPHFDRLKHVLIETNCAVPLKDDFIKELNNWTDKQDAFITWSNSPKLSVSGEKWEEAIRPDIADMQRGVKRSEQYFKFVCGPNEKDFNEVEKAMKLYNRSYRLGGAPEVYIMPEACTREQQEDIAQRVAHMCMERGYIYCHRVQNSVFGNTVGT